VLPGVFGFGESSRGFHYNLGANAFPRNRCRIFFFEYFELLTVNRDGISLGANVMLQITQDRVVLQQMRQRLGVGKVIDRHQIEVLIVESGAQDIATDAAKSVDADLTAIVPPRGIQAAQKACDADGKLKIVPLHDSAAQILANDDAPRASVIQTQHAQMDAGPSPQKEKPAH
jgi:hypothetical protein